jgi:BTB/POZ domain-containing protein 9
MTLSGEAHFYSYIIEVSSDESNWKKVIDYSQYKCHSRQSLFFEGHVIRAIRIVRSLPLYPKGDYKPMLVTYFTCGFYEKSPRVSNGLINSNINVAISSYGARVLDGHPQDAAILMGKTWANKLSQNDFRAVVRGLNKPLTIHLPQPHVVGSFSFTPQGNPANVGFSYYADISMDMKSWKEVASFRSKECHGTQTITFDFQPVSYVRITGTQGFDGKLAVVHFECPVPRPKQPPAPKASHPPKAPKPRRLVGVATGQAIGQVTGQAAGGHHQPQQTGANAPKPRRKPKPKAQTSGQQVAAPFPSSQTEKLVLKGLNFNLHLH